MSVLSTFWSALGWGGLSNKEKGEQSSGPTARTTESGLVVSDQRAMQVSAVWASVGLISELTSTLPLGVYERTKDGRRAVEDHYLYELLRVSPNGLMTPQEFREAMTMQLALYGNGYAYIDRRNGVPVSLTPLRPDCMVPIRDGATVTYHYSSDGGVRVFAKESIFHLKGKSVDGIVGLSPLAYARHSLGITVSADKYASKAFGANGRPPGYLSFDQFLKPEQREQARTLYEGVSVDDSKLWVLEGGSKYETISIPPDDMQMLESRQFQVSDIARFWRVPPHLINDTEKSTSWGTGIEQQNLGFLQYTLQPYLTRWESTASNALLSRTDRRKYFVSHNVEGLLRADSAARSAFYSAMAQNGIYTRNEIRKKENLPPDPDGDQLTVQVNLTPVAQLESIGGNQNKPD